MGFPIAPSTYVPTRFATNQDDGAVVRDIESRDSLPQTMTYNVIVRTGDVRGAGTDADVSIVMYGTQGESDVCKLDNIGKNNFERNQTDTFPINCNDIGKYIRQW